MKKINKVEKNNSGFRPLDLNHFEPLQIKVRNNRFDEACKIFKSLVQKEQVLALYNEKQRYEKPSIKKRRKSMEAQQRKLATELKQKMMDSGEWEKKKQKKEQKKASKKKNKESNNEKID